MAVIELHGLSKWYGEVIGLNNVTAAIGHGITGLLGPNGAGKTTLMGLATGQLRPSQGRIRVLGQRVWDNPRLLARLGYCPEGDPFWGAMTGWRYVLFLARLSGLRGAAAGAAAGTAIERVGMQEHMHRAIRGYSKGMRQRIKIAQALVHRPQLLILDEPLTGADPVSRHELTELLRALAAEGVDILVSSHVLHEVEALTRQILLIDHGRIVAEGELGAVRQQIHDRPHTIRIRVDDPRRLAAGVVPLPAVTGVKLLDGQTLAVETRAPDEVYAFVNGAAAEGRVNVQEIAAADESLEAVFGYLTEHRL
ncbi:MAG TPA: ABC transporter ATP-binding protein [Phycisphaerae bacterium]|jgi:ABC-2 type transport system ATP-binding protein|nr:ABC transporter ATP-binding protein [Phycisphaerae bacterium]HPC22589.1 ABC transporter ATP-binding protein [Phycisphaerae bacterium]HRS28552.1 ABC transporter ATP-binding protein [Phycisphaerae bacterium]HRT41363.1 ABC transporter ATP-binding protein [Phycisphaerae bacterium]